MSTVVDQGSVTAGEGGRDVGVRDVAWTDIPVLVDLDTQLFAADAWSAATWWSEIAERPRREYVVLAGADGQVLGYGGLDHGGELADVMTIAVAPGSQGRGLGRAILAELESRARAQGARHVLLEVRADNESAVTLYVRNGWSQLSIRRRYYQPGDVDALILRKSFSDKEDS